MEQQLHVGPPEKGSEREKQFKESLEKLNKTVLSIVRSRKEGDDTMDIPFIDALLQSAVPEEQVFPPSLPPLYLPVCQLLLCWSPDIE